MFEAIRNKYLYDKTQIVTLNKSGRVLSSDDLIFAIPPHTLISDFHPFFETVMALLEENEKNYTFSCIHLETDSQQKIVDVIFNSGNEQENPFLIFIDFTYHYTTFQSIAQEKNESILSFHISEMKNKQLEAEKKFKDKFLTNVSHDLRTPVSASVWFVGMLEKSILTTEQKEIVALLKETTGHIKVLVDDILDLSKIEMGLIKIQRKPIALKEIVTTVTQVILPKTKEKNIDFQVFFDEQIPAELLGDKARITQIIINLLDNAVKFTRKGKISLSVSLSELQEATAHIHITVADTGVGINTDDKALVFESFKKLHQSKKIDGLGLGLSIVLNLLNLMGGHISFETELQVGTTFAVAIPLQLP